MAQGKEETPSFLKEGRGGFFKKLSHLPFQEILCKAL